VNFKELVPVGRDCLTIREVLQVLRSNTMRSTMKTIGMTGDNIMSVFQKLDVTATGIVRVNDLVDGLMRLRVQQLGVDVAGSKSNIRRLLTEVGQLERDSIDSASCCNQVVQSLRGVEIVDEVDLATITSCQSRASSRESTASSFVAEIEQKLHKDITHLDQKIKNMQMILKKHRHQFKRWVGHRPREQLHDMADLENGRENTALSVQTITSAAPGWD